jgi:hypothetical protein
MENQVPPVSDAELAALYFTERMTTRIGNRQPTGPYANEVARMLWPFHPSWHKPSHKGVAGQFVPAIAGSILSRCYNKGLIRTHSYPDRFDYLTTPLGRSVLEAQPSASAKAQVAAYQERSLRQALKRYYGNVEKFTDFHSPGRPIMTFDGMVERLYGWQMVNGLR